MKYDLEDLALTLKEIRMQRGLSQRDVAEKIGFSQGKYFRVENGLAKMEEKDLYVLAKVLKISLRNLLNYGENKRTIPLAHLQGDALEFVLDPENADYIQEAIINMQIRELEKKKAKLHNKEEREIEVDYGMVVRKVTKLFDESVGGIGLENLQEAIELVDALQEDGAECVARLNVASIELTELLKSKINSDEPIDPEDLLNDCDNCVQSLREI